MKSKEMGIDSETIKKRLEQAKEMSEIWDENQDPVRMYLKGCIVTAAALAGGDGDFLKTG